MIRVSPSNLAFSMCLVVFQMMIAPELSAKELTVLSEQTASGFGHIESVAYDPRGKVLYTSDFGPDLKPADKDGKGKITKVSLDGKILEDTFLPAKARPSTSRKASGSRATGCGSPTSIRSGCSISRPRKARNSICPTSPSPTTRP